MFTICRVCNEIVDPADTTLQYAVEVREVRSLTGTEYVEGREAYFHAACFPWVRGYRAKRHPLADEPEQGSAA